jgi:hypothetical protein
MDKSDVVVKVDAGQSSDEKMKAEREEYLASLERELKLLYDQIVLAQTSLSDLIGTKRNFDTDAQIVANSKTKNKKKKKTENYVLFFCRKC